LWRALRKRIVECCRSVRPEATDQFLVLLFLAMTARTKKILVNIGMLVFVILSFIRWDGDPTFHIIVGTVCTLFFAFHIAIHRKWLTSITGKVAKRTANAKVTRLYVVDVLLLVTWGVAIITGFLAIPPYLSEIEGMSWLGRIHGVSSRIACIIAVVHIIQHSKQIRSYFKRRNKSG